MTLRLALPGGSHACTDPGDMFALAPAVMDANAAVVCYGGTAVQIFFDAGADVPGLEAAVARVGSIEPESIRATLLTDAEAGLDPVEAEAVGALDVAMVEALASPDAAARRAVLAGYVLVALRRQIRVNP